jgi:hypothetical protein
MPPSADDLPGRRLPARKERRAAERAEQKRSRGKQPGSPGAAMRWHRPDEIVPHFPEGACACGLDLENHGITTSGWWQEQLDLCLIGIIATFGWEKALGDATELSWWETTVTGAAARQHIPIPGTGQ